MRRLGGKGQRKVELNFLGMNKISENREAKKAFKASMCSLIKEIDFKTRAFSIPKLASENTLKASMSQQIKQIESKTRALAHPQAKNIYHPRPRRFLLIA
jgi:hypothetical protein